jgi:2-dehydro-3-deoxygluconokinase
MTVAKDHFTTGVSNRRRGWPDVAKAKAAFEALYRITDITLKGGGEGSLVADKSGVAHVPPVLVEEVVDTTAAGDSFNAGYLAARQGGASPQELPWLF